MPHVRRVQEAISVTSMLANAPWKRVLDGRLKLKICRLLKTQATLHSCSGLRPGPSERSSLGGANVMELRMGAPLQLRLERSLADGLSKLT